MYAGRYALSPGSADDVQYGAVLAKSSHPIYFSIPSHRGWVQAHRPPLAHCPLPALSLPSSPYPPLETTCGQSCPVRWAAFAGEGILAQGWGALDSFFFDGVFCGLFGVDLGAQAGVILCLPCACTGERASKRAVGAGVI